MSKIDFLQYFLEFDSISSTNAYIKQNYLQLPNFTVVKAKYQTDGHGQFGRVWESDYDRNLLFSLLIKKDLPFLIKDINSLVVSALLNTLDDYGIEAIFKYPNDILIGSKKVAGILIETKFDNKQLEYMIIGVALNINQEKFETPNAISLKHLTKNEININDVFKKFFKHLSNNVLLANLLYLGRVSEISEN